MKKFFLNLPLMIVLFCAPVLLCAQTSVQMTLALQPPYSPYFSDYLTYENKGLLTIVKPGQGNMNIFLKAKITGDNGISGATKPGFKPFTPIVLSMPVTIMKGSDFETYFSLGNFNFVGISARAIAQGAGFPEGNYSICIQAFDFTTGAAVSNDACFQLHIVYPEAPLPNIPLCESKVIPNDAQSFSFVWSCPGAPATTRYVLKMVELVKGQVPADALISSGTPPFFEKEVTITSYPYKTFDPVLTKGKKYAWQVTAYDLQKKVLFRNNGVSPACSFSYGNDAITKSYAYTKADTMQIVSPECNGHDSLIVGGQHHLGATWIWGFMKDTLALKTPPAKASGKKIGSYAVEIRPTQQAGLSKAAVPGSIDKSFKLTIPPDKLFIDLDPQEVVTAGLKYDHWYKIIVQALDTAGNQIDYKTSCPVRIAKAAAGLDTALITGSLSYRLEDGGTPFGASLVSFWATLSKQSDHNTLKQNDNVSTIKVAVKTDSNGKFSIAMPLDDQNRYYRYLDITLNNGYLAQPSKNIPLDSFQNFETAAKRSTGLAPKPVLIIKKLEDGDEVTVGQRKLDAYSYSLNVRIGKGFPQFYYDTAKGISAASENLDTLTINSLVKVAGGLPVFLYRKVKAGDILYDEGDHKIIGQIGNIKDGRLIVAQGYTAIEKVGGEDRTMVHFKRLLCNRNSINPQDVYYMQVQLPSKDKRANNLVAGPVRANTNKTPEESLFSKGGKPDSYVLSAEDDDQDQYLEAPEQMIAFPKGRLPKNKTHGQLDTIYNLISSLPPMSEISGKLLYAWPKNHNIQHPLSNAKFTVRVGYRISGITNNNADLGPGKCPVLLEKMYDENGDPWGPTDDNAIMGVGETDEQGKFKLRVVNYDQKGLITKKGTKEILSMDCNPAQEQLPNAGGGYITPVDELKDIWQPNDPAAGINIYAPITQPGDATNGPGYQVIGATGLAAAAPGNQTRTFATQALNPGGVQLVGAGAMVQLGGAMNGPVKTFKPIMKFGPAMPSDNDNDNPGDGKQFLPVYRYYYIQLENPWGHYVYIPDEITAQAFETKNIGTLVGAVNAMEKQITVKVSGHPNMQLDQAKMVIFRDEGQIPPSLPIGEGSPEHPMKELISESMLYKTNETKKEWILQDGFAIKFAAGVNKFVIHKDSSLLSSPTANYRMQIAPDPGKAGTRFMAVNKPLGDEVSVILLDAKLVGRVMELGAKGTPVPGATVIVKVIGGLPTNPASVELTTDKDGYFEYAKGQLDSKNKVVDWTYGSKVPAKLELSVKKAGYKDTILGQQNAPEMGVQVGFDIKLQPASTISGKVVGENGEGIEAYIMREDSSVFSVPTPLKQWNNTLKRWEFTANTFVIPTASGANKKFIIIPKDPAYFDKTIVQNIANGSNALGDVVMFNRKHRIRFIVTELKANGGNIDPGMELADQFKITINNKYTAANKAKQNIVSFDPFENVSVNNYTVVIEDMKGIGFVPQTLNITNTESTDYTTYYLAMRMGGSISGKVTMAGGVAVKGAKVYVEHGAAGGNASLFTKQNGAWSEMETTSNDSGLYIIKGIPLNEASIKLHATLTGQGTVNGATANVAMINGTGTANFILSKLPNITLTSVWGFPLTIEDIKQNGLNYTVSGLVDLSANPGAFSWLDNNTSVRIKDIPFKTIQMNGKNEVVPNADEIKIAETGLKMRYQNRYNVALTTDTLAMVASPLVIKKSNVGAIVYAYAHIVDNSYNYPSSYLEFTKNKTGDFYLCLNANNTNNTRIPALSSSLQNGLLYHLSDRFGKPLKFTFIGFDTYADPANSYIDALGKVHLDISFKGAIPNTDPGYVDIHIKDMVLDQNKIEPAVGSEPLVAMLGGGWKLLVNSWSVDPQQGGIYSHDAVIQTGIADLKMGTFNLRKDLFVMDDFDPNNITLGNGAILLEKVSKNAALVFDHKIGSDGGAHWRFNIAPDGGDPAAVFYLDGAAKQQKLNLEYIQLIAYNNNKENIITLGSTAVPFFHNPKVSFIPNTISSGDGVFTLKGDATFIDVPRAPSVSLSLLYQKTGNTLTRKLDPFKFEFDGKGYVQYQHKTSDSIIIDEAKGLITLAGTVREPDKTDAIPCRFTFGDGNAGEIRLQKGYRMTVSPGHTYLELGESVKPNNGMWVDGSDWTTLKFSGLLKGGGGTLDTNKNKLAFEVLGEITASADSVKATGIDAGFGKLDMVFDFPTSTMHGSMHMDNMAFGTWMFTGDVEVLFGPGGFLSMASGQLNTGILFADGFGVFSAGLLLGDYTLSPDIIKKTIQFSKNPQASCWLTKNMEQFKGFYFTGGYDVLNESEGFDIGIASVYYNAVLGIEASIGMNLTKSASLLGLGAHGRVTAGASAITGTSISGFAEAHVTAEAEYVPGSFSIKGLAAVSVGFNVCQHIPFVENDLCWGESAGAGAKFGFGSGNSYFNFFLGTQGSSECQQ